MDAQELHELMARRETLDLTGSKDRLKALLQAKNGSSLEPLRPTELDPVAMLMRNNPSLTLEQAIKDAEALGF